MSKVNKKNNNSNDSTIEFILNKINYIFHNIKIDLQQVSYFGYQ